MTDAVESAMSPEHQDALNRLHADLGLKPLNPAFAKLEVFGGLLSVAAGVLIMLLWAGRPAGDVPVTFAVGGIALFVLGGYLALAGHRSHLYQSNNLLVAYLALQFRKQTPKV